MSRTAMLRKGEVPEAAVPPKPPEPEKVFLTGRTWDARHLLKSRGGVWNPQRKGYSMLRASYEALLREPLPPSLRVCLDGLVVEP